MTTATTPKSKGKTENKTKAAPSASARAVRPAAKRDNRETIDRSAETAENVLEQVETGGRNAIGAVRRFVDSVDESLAGSDEGPTRAHDIVDAALVMSDRMVEMGGDAVRGIVRGVSRNDGAAAKQ